MIFKKYFSDVTHELYNSKKDAKNAELRCNSNPAVVEQITKLRASYLCELALLRGKYKELIDEQIRKL